LANSDLPPEIKEILLSQQQQIAKLSEMIGGLSEAVLAGTSLSGKVHEHAIGQAAAFQVFAEVLMSASPDLKRHVAIAMGQLLSRPEATPNEHLRNVVAALHKAATDGRNGPEGRRADLRVVPPPGESGNR
jgi:hypothetical protein